MTFLKKAIKSSLENADQWIEDAKLLMENGSYGHAYSLLSFADEEIAKSYVCWLVSEKVVPPDSKYAKDVFSDHRPKLQTLLGLELSPFFRTAYEHYKKEYEYEKFDFTEEDLNKLLAWMDDIVSFKGRMRNVGIYVDLNEKEGKITTPKSISKQASKTLLKGVNNRFLVVKKIISETTEAQKIKLRQFFKNIPKEAWKTGNIVRL